MSAEKATRIQLFTFRTPQMRAFHVTWVSFFICFFAWFGVAPLMPAVRDELGLDKTQIGNTIVASVAGTIVARLIIGWLCDRYGPRRVYTVLLAIAALPVLGVALAQTYEQLLVARLLLGAIGASFVVTQYHTSLMFAPNTVGTANAVTAGWGNLGGGVTQMVMPLVMAALLLFGVGAGAAWRLSLILPAILLVLAAFAYHFLTQDTPAGNFSEPSFQGRSSKQVTANLRAVLADPRVWVLAAIYGACFGVELTINNVAAMYFRDRFGLGLTAAGLLAGAHGAMNLFARALGGLAGDRAGARFGVRGRALLLGALVFAEGLSLMAFAGTGQLGLAIVLLVTFSLFVAMSCGATFAVVPFIQPKALGSVAGVVGAGGNLGAVLAGLLFRYESLSVETALLYVGAAVTCISVLALVIRLKPMEERALMREPTVALDPAPAE